MRTKLLIIGALLLALAGFLAVYHPAPTLAQAQPTPTIPNLDAWTKSPHADVKAEAFNHWNTTDNKSVPVECARCHSTTGYQDYLGADGSAVGTVEKPVPVGETVECEACHNAATAALTSVTFPSGQVVNGLGPEARCMECHQGAASMKSVDAAVDKAGLTKDVDKVSDQLGFVNVHYRAAAATQYGTWAQGGYEYAGKAYEAKFDHVQGYNACVNCHDPHSSELKVDKCATCHTNVKTKDDLKNIRMAGSQADYNGNGDTKEGMAKEIEGLQAMTLQAIQAYAKEKAGKAIAYNPNVYPYFFNDTNGDGKAGDDEAKFENAYKSWTSRLLKAAYNYQFSVKDPGQYAHNGKYVVELLYDSIDDLNASGMSGKVDLSKAARIDFGHFNGSAEQWRHWDAADPAPADGIVPRDCVKCHTASGLVTFLDEASRASDKVSGANIAVAPPSGSLNCGTCHDDLSKFTRRPVDKVKFPSGAVVDIGNKDANLCLECHQGRESMVSLTAAIKASGLTDDQVATKDKSLSFRNPHYFAAGATLMGSETHGAYEYANQKYNGRTLHPAPNNTCVDCHDVHTGQIQLDKCGTCHAAKTVEDLFKIRKPNDTVDYNGNKNNTEGFAEEITGMADKLLAEMQKYATTRIKVNGPDGKPLPTGIVYSGASYPYFFIDTNGNGKADPEEVNSKNAYTSWTPRLLRAAYNYQWVQKDPGSFAHNFYYIDQVLYDSIKDLNPAGVAGMTRATFTAPPTPTPAPTAAPAAAATATPAAAPTATKAP
jgi:hypothetical protein